MKHDHHKKFTGVWLDQHEAFIVTTENHEDHGEFAVREKIASGHHTTAGSEHTVNRAAQGNAHQFYKSLAQRLIDYDEIYLFGPGRAHEELKNVLVADKHFLSKRIHSEPAEHLSDKQLVAKVRSYFQPKMHNS